MRRIWWYVSALSALCTLTSVSSAQQQGRVALVIAHPGQAGLLWHPGDRLALRWDVAYSHTSDERESGSTSHLWSITTGLTGLRYLFRSDSLRGYLAPRLSFSRTTNQSQVTSVTYGGDLSFGLQYGFSRRFSAFGETGLGYAYRKRWIFSSMGFLLFGGHSETWSTIAGLGLLMYF
jgi:hypothetical protein